MNALSPSRRYGPAQTHAKDQGLHGLTLKRRSAFLRKPNDGFHRSAVVIPASTCVSS